MRWTPTPTKLSITYGVWWYTHTRGEKEYDGRIRPGFTQDYGAHLHHEPCPHLHTHKHSFMVSVLHDGRDEQFGRSLLSVPMRRRDTTFYTVVVGGAVMATIPDGDSILELHAC
jgi:hypothetical protein